MQSRTETARERREAHPSHAENPQKAMDEPQCVPAIRELAEAGVEFMEAGSVLIRARKRRHAGVRVEAAEEGKRYRSARSTSVVKCPILFSYGPRCIVAANPVGNDDSRLPGQIRGGELRPLRRGDDDVDIAEELCHRGNRQGAGPHGLYVIDRRVEPRDTEGVGPIKGLLPGQELVAAAARHLVEGGSAFRLEHRNDLPEGKLGHLDLLQRDAHLAAQHLQRGLGVLQVVHMAIVLLLLLLNRALGVGCIWGERL